MSDQSCFESYESAYEPIDTVHCVSPEGDLAHCIRRDGRLVPFGGATSARLPASYYTSAHSDYGFGSFRAAPETLPEANHVYAKARVALEAAQSAVANPGWFSDDASISAMRGGVNKVATVYLPRLAQTMPTTASSANDLRKWADTAGAIISQLDSVTQDMKQQGALNNAVEALEGAVHTFVSTIVEVAERASGIVGRAVLGPILASPLFWLAAAGGAAWVFKAPIARALAKGVR